MPRNFDVSAATSALRNGGWKEPRVFMRLVLGVLLLANLVAAAFAFHVFGTSPEQLNRQVEQTTQQVSAARTRLDRTKNIAGKVQLARSQGDQFVASFMTPRRTTYSAIVAELQEAAEASQMTWKEGTIAPLEPVKGSESLSMMTITASFEGSYQNLLKFVNLLDRSARFLIIGSLQATPQPNGKALSVTVKVNAFVRDDFGASI